MFYKFLDRQIIIVIFPTESYQDILLSSIFECFLSNFKAFNTVLQAKDMMGTRRREIWDDISSSSRGLCTILLNLLLLWKDSHNTGKRGKRKAARNMFLCSSADVTQTGCFRQARCKIDGRWWFKPKYTPWISLTNTRLFWKFRLQRTIFPGYIECAPYLVFWYLLVRYDRLLGIQYFQERQYVWAEIFRTIWCW